MGWADEDGCGLGLLYSSLLLNLNLYYFINTGDVFLCGFDQ